FRFWAKAAIRGAGKSARQSVFSRVERSLSTAAPPLAASTATGNSPNRSIWINAAERSATSIIPSTTSPVRRRALYENCGINRSFFYLNLIFSQKLRRIQDTFSLRKLPNRTSHTAPPNAGQLDLVSAP